VATAPPTARSFQFKRDRCHRREGTRHRARPVFRCAETASARESSPDSLSSMAKSVRMIGLPASRFASALSRCGENVGSPVTSEAATAILGGGTTNLSGQVRAGCRHSVG
jgi:hypothetical protein